MKLYIANCTNQIKSLNFRMPEGKGRGYSTQNIGMGAQAQIAGDLNRLQIDAIVEQMELFGLRAIADLNGVTIPVPLIYSLDKPVPVDLMKEVIAHNSALLKKQGSVLRREAAIAASHGMREFSPQAAETLSMSVEEEKAGTMDHGGDEPLAEGFRMDREYGRA